METMELLKVCLKCKIEKPFSHFGTRNRNSHGKRGRCKICEREDRLAAYTPEIKEKERLAAKKWYWNNRERSHKTQKIWCENNKERRFEYQRRRELYRKYGITLEKYKEMFDAQNGKCKICYSDEPKHNEKQKRSFYIDHCHKTNIIRGLLCTHCNLALGQFNDDPVLLRRAAEYVEKNGQI